MKTQGLAVARTCSENRFKMKVEQAVIPNQRHLPWQWQKVQSGRHSPSPEQKKAFFLSAWQQNWFNESCVKKIPYRRKCSIVNSTLIRPKRIYIGEQPELKIPRKWGFTDFAAHATTHFISYVFLKSFLYQNGKSCAKLKAISSCQAWAQRGDNTRDRNWSLVGSSGNAATTQTNVLKPKRQEEKQSRHRQS